MADDHASSRTKKHSAKLKPMIVGSPESENKETGDDKEVEADADKDEEPEDDPKLVGDCQKENGDQSVENLGGEGGVRVHLKKGQEPVG